MDWSACAPLTSRSGRQGRMRLGWRGARVDGGSARGGLRAVQIARARELQYIELQYIDPMLLGPPHQPHAKTRATRAEAGNGGGGDAASGCGRGVGPGDGAAPSAARPPPVEPQGMHGLYTRGVARSERRRRRRHRRRAQYRTSPQASPRWRIRPCPEHSGSGPQHPAPAPCEAYFGGEAKSARAMTQRRHGHSTLASDSPPPSMAAVTDRVPLR